VLGKSFEKISGRGLWPVDPCHEDPGLPAHGRSKFENLYRFPAGARVVAFAALTVISACAHTPETPKVQGVSPVAGELPGGPASRPPESGPLELPLEKPHRQEEKARIYPGSGVFVKAPSKAKGGAAPEGAGEVTLNFENADLREVVKVILGDMLNENYVLDPRVRGAVTVQTSRPLSRADLMPTLNTLLRMNGAALVRTATGYEVVPLASAVQGTVTPELEGVSIPLRPGYAVLVVPLKYIGVAEMQKLLEPFAPPGSILKADESRNLLVLGGSRQELAHLADTIRVFDVDWLAGMSVGLFPLKNVEAKTVAEELDHVLGGKAGGPLAGMVRVMPIERLNALLVVTQQPKYLDDARTWIQRLDRTSTEAGRQLYVYQVQNGKAEHLAEVLGELFGGTKAKPTAPRPAQVAPGLTGTQIGFQPGAAQFAEGVAEPPAPPETAYQVGATGTLGTGAVGGGGMLGGGTLGGGRFAQPRLSQAGRAGAAGTGGVTTAQVEGVSIIADTETNSLLILATAAEYEKIEGAIRRLDTVPRQVLIEATIAEVTLTGDLKYGLQWFFDNKVGAYKGIGSLSLTTDNTANDLINGAITSASAVGSPFTYALTDSGGFVRAFLNTLAADSLLNVISSPQLMVTDNQTAQIQVGDQVPVTTGTTVVSGTAGTVSSFQYLQTGVVLQVTPRVNAGGLVNMELSQQVSNQVPNSTGPGGNPTISQRAIQSVVVVQSGETLVLGGLIRNTDSRGKSGVPGLYKMPIIGPLFGTTSTHKDRTELVVLITPRVVRDQREARRVTEEIRRKLEETIPYSEQFPWKGPRTLPGYGGAG
jgi:general secretion pathway protein D